MALLLCFYDSLLVFGCFVDYLLIMLFDHVGLINLLCLELFVCV